MVLLSKTEALDDFASRFQSFGHLLPVFITEFSQHIVNLPSFGKIIPDAEAQTGIILGTQCGSDMFQTVVSGITTFAFQTPEEPDRRLLSARFPTESFPAASSTVRRCRSDSCK